MTDVTALPILLDNSATGAPISAAGAGGALKRSITSQAMTTSATASASQYKILTPLCRQPLHRVMRVQTRHRICILAGTVQRIKDQRHWHTSVSALAENCFDSLFWLFRCSRLQLLPGLRRCYIDTQLFVQFEQGLHPDHAIVRQSILLLKQAHPLLQRRVKTSAGQRLGCASRRANSCATVATTSLSSPSASGFSKPAGGCHRNR